MGAPALDFPNPPLTVGQTWGGTNGVTYTWDGAVWTATAASGGGGGGGGSPTGPAGGDLTGTYPNPTIGPLAVGNAEISDVAYSKVTGAPTIPTTLPPSGPAGGDLTGTYPNPTVGPLAVGNAEISDLAYSKLTGAPTIPTTLPPTGAAGGSLAGTYPNPTLAPTGVTAGSYGAVTKVPVVTVTAEGRVSGVTEATLPTSYPPSGAAGGALSGTYPNPGVTYSAITGTPTSLPPSGAAGGALTGTYPNPGVSYAAITGTPSSLPPSGAAGGDLTGTYPNPTVAKLAGAAVGTTTPLARGDVLVANATPALGRLALGTNGQVLQSNGTDALWGAAPASPPSGPAGGALSGTYPNPGVTYSAITGTPTSLPPSGAAGGALTGTYPNPGVSYAAITGTPTSLPPSGAASGDLSGTYPGPTVAKVNGAALGTTTPLARGDLLVANSTPALARLPLGAASTVLQSNGTDAVWGASLGGPPSGAAGGDLQGTYPNPTLKPSGAIAGGYGSATQWVGFVLGADGRIQSTSLYTAPTTLPPSGSASGDLTGTYPGPTVAKVNGQALTAGDIYYVSATPAITRLAANATATNQYLRSVSSGVPSWQQIAYADVSGTPTALPPNGAAGGDLQGTYPNPTIIPSHLPWSVSGSLLTPTDATKTIAVPGPSGTTGTLLLGAALAKGRVAAWSGSGTATGAALTLNRDFNNNAQDDATKASWSLNLRHDLDNCTVTRSAAGVTTQTTLLTVDNAGNLTITGATATKAAGGSGTAWATTSDRRIKADISDYAPGLSAVVQLLPRAFVYNGKGGSVVGRRGWGFIADELAPVFPEAVDTYRGELDGEQTDIQRVDVSNVTLALVNAVKELEARLRAVEAR